VVAEAIVATGKIIVGLGNGGALFFDAAGVRAIGHGYSMGTGQSGVRVIEPGHPAYAGPNPVTVVAGEMVELYESSFAWTVRHLDAGEGLPEPIPYDPVYYEGYIPAAETHASILSVDDGRLRQWGSWGLPSQLTVAGRFALTNFIAWQLPQPDPLYVVFVPFIAREP
jgi:hypothetical protein